ncbi:hypothetical protein B0H13DRAFT_2386920 [Mycena leptocephala]|nr:hypothetical protein B0H13DRAFT_2386920 [Mycena leptocephala]
MSLLTIHLRRGDYDQHCNNLADWNLFGRPASATPRATRPPGLPRRPRRCAAARRRVRALLAQPRGDRQESAVRAVRAVSASGEVFPAQYLRSVYIATNGDQECVAALAAPLTADGWERVASSQDMPPALVALVAVGTGLDRDVLVSVVLVEGRNGNVGIAYLVEHTLEQG